MADQYGNLSPEDYAQQQQINRQQRMAEMLMQNTQQPQGQMVSGRYVAPSFFQNILPLVNAYQGRRLLEQGDLKQQQLAEAIRGRNSQDLEKFIDLSQGSKDFKPAVSYPTKPVISESSDLGPQSYPPIENQVGQAPNKQAAALLALRSYDPTLRQLGGSMLSQMTKEPELVNVAPGGSLVRNVNGKVESVFTAPEKAEKPPVSYQEYLLAKADPIQPFKGSYREYQIEDANRKTPRITMPSQGRAPQVIDTANGPMLVNTYTSQATPIMANGQALAPKLNPEQTKDIVSINQQRSTIKGAIDAVKQNAKAFSFERGLAQNLPAGETIAGRFETPEATQARAYVFNNVSAVIKERAGTAQSASEMQRINSFMPSPKDSDKQIIAKLEGFNQFLDDQEKGTRINPNVVTPVSPQNNSGFTIREKK